MLWIGRALVNFILDYGTFQYYEDRNFGMES